MLKIHPNIVRIVSHAFLLSTLMAFTILAQTKTDTDVRPLTIEQPIERELKGGQIHSYIVQLVKGQYFRAEVVPQGVFVNTRLYAPDGSLLAEMDGKNGWLWRSSVSAVAEAGGEYRVEVRTSEKELSIGKYSLHADHLRPMTPQDRQRIMAEKALAEAIALRSKKNLPSALEKLNPTVEVWEALGEKKWLAMTLINIGWLVGRLGDSEREIATYAQAMSYSREIGDRIGEERAVKALGDGYRYSNRLENPQLEKERLEKVQRYYEQSLLIIQELKDKRTESYRLFNLGEIYEILEESEKARKRYEQSLKISQQLGDRSREESVLFRLGTLHFDSGRYELARDLWEQTLIISRELNDKLMEGDSLGNLGIIFHVLGQYERAREYYEESVIISQELKDRSGESSTLMNLGNLYKEFEQYSRAASYYEQALTIDRELKDRYGESAVLGNLGMVYLHLKQYERAKEVLEQALFIKREVLDSRGEGIVIGNLGNIYLSLGHYERAREYYEKALTVGRKIRDPRTEAESLSRLGFISDKHFGKVEDAQNYYEQALVIQRELNDRRGESLTLSNLMTLYAKLSKFRLAVFYGKQSVKASQELRKNIKKLDKESRQGFVRSVEDTYRRTSEILISQGRVTEAQQILNSFKDQRFFDFDQTSIKQAAPLAMMLQEDEFVARYEKTSGLMGVVKEQLDDLRERIGDEVANAEQNTQIQELASELKTATDEFLSVLKQAELEFSKPYNEKDKIGETPDKIEMEAALQELSMQTGQNAVAVYQLVGEENFHALIITPDDMKSVSTPIKATVLNEQAKQFWALLQTPNYDTTKLGKQLYDTIFKPIEKELPKGTKTILWSLDGNLRYVPMAALYDGKQFLIEKYNHVNFTRADKERMTRRISPAWTATAFGSSKQQTVELLGDKISFSPLPGVGEEMSMLFQQKEKKGGIFDGATLVDSNFTKESMLEALKQKRPVVHIASHFSFRPGDEARSFLLMGDGTAFTLDEMKKHPDMFAGVEMLTLSACNTAAQQPDANGRDVDAFFELAQRLGANSVMATLWSVADNSTPWLMREFYQTKLDKKLSKAEALRRAQLSLLKGKAEIKPLATRTNLSPVKIEIAEDAKTPSETARSEIIKVKKQDAPLYDKTKHPPFAHPFYWSPFVLFGNWK